MWSVGFLRCFLVPCYLFVPLSGQLQQPPHPLEADSVCEGDDSVQTGVENMSGTVCKLVSISLLCLLKC